MFVLFVVFVFKQANLSSVIHIFECLDFRNGITSKHLVSRKVDFTNSIQSVRMSLGRIYLIKINENMGVLVNLAINGEKESVSAETSVKLCCWQTKKSVTR